MLDVARQFHQVMTLLVSRPKASDNAAQSAPTKAESSNVYISGVSCRDIGGNQHLQ
jgi:hypothetical protein